MASTEGSGQQGPPQQQSVPQQVTTSVSNVQLTQSQVQQQQPTPSPQQQIQLQQANVATAQSLHGAQQQHQANQNQQQQMQQLLISSSPQQYNLQNLQQLLGQQIIMQPGNFLNSNMNSPIQPAQLAPSIQVLKPLQNQFTAHMLQPGTTSYTIPTSGSNNSVGQQYIISNFSPTSPLQLQHQQGKPGEMTKMIGAQLQQGIWPQLFTTGGQNSFLIRGAHPDQMTYIQPQMTSNATAQHFSMQPIQSNGGQLGTTSMAPVTSAQVQQTIQQGNIQQQQQQNQSQPHPIQPQPSVVSIKTPNLQPKPPPLQIQPNTQQQATHQIQHQHQFVTMQQNPQQIQMIPQATTASMIPQSISITQSQPQGTTTTQVLQQAQQQHVQNQNQPRLTIIPQGNQLQNQSVHIIQHQQQPQAIRPNFTTAGLTVMSQQNSQATTTNGPQLPQPRQKIRKSSVARGGTTTLLQPPRLGTTMITVPNPQQPKQLTAQQQHQQGQAQQLNTTLTRIPVTVTSSPSLQQPQQMVQHLKTINISAIQPNLPDATITPLIPQSSQQQQQQPTTTVQSIPQTLQVFTTQVPSPIISITPAPPPSQMTPKKEEVKEQKAQGHEQKSETEKENKNIKNNSVNGVVKEEPDEVLVKHKLPKAMVKPQVLTHVIEGFVIQEAAEPFPMPKNSDLDEPPKKKSAVSGEMGKCEMCGKVDLKAKFKKNKRFCSSQCAKGMKAAQQQAQATSTVSQGNNIDGKSKKGQVRKWGEGMEFIDETSSSLGETSTNDDHGPMDVEEGRLNPVKWGVSEVVDFVRSLPGCSEYADDFAVQEIDGQALLLLKEDHLMSAIGMKLGPALKLCAKIENLRSGSSSSSNSDAVPAKA